MPNTLRFSLTRMLAATVTTGLVAVASALPAQQLVARADSVHNAAMASPAKPLSERIAAAARPGTGESVYGRATLPDLGKVTVILVREGSPQPMGEDAVWPVQLRWVLAARRASDSYVADLYGRASDSGKLYLDGVISDGPRAGSSIHIETNGDLGRGASITITPKSPK